MVPRYIQDQTHYWTCQMQPRVKHQLQVIVAFTQVGQFLEFKILILFSASKSGSRNPSIHSCTLQVGSATMQSNNLQFITVHHSLSWQILTHLELTLFFLRNRLTSKTIDFNFFLYRWPFGPEMHRKLYNNAVSGSFNFVHSIHSEVLRRQANFRRVESGSREMFRRLYLLPRLK